MGGIDRAIKVDRDRPRLSVSTVAGKRVNPVA
jgi:hypothetical protein